MRVLLIMPTKSYANDYPTFLSITDFPIGFAYLASALKSAGHEVFGLNPNNDPNHVSAYEMLHAKIRDSLQENQPQLIGIGGLCTHYKFLHDAIHIIRLYAPSVPIVCGGGIINYDAEFIFKTLRPDFCIIGEGEEVLVQLANVIENGQEDYEPIPNLGYWEKGIPTFTKQDFNYVDVNTRNFPDYTPFGIDETIDKFSLAASPLCRYPRLNPRPMTIVAARSCPFNCSFCVHRRSAKYRARSIENIIKEIYYLYERYNFNILIISDELFAINKNRLNEFCLALADGREKWRWDFNWTFQTHASAKLGREELKLAKETGCYFFSYGIESASPQVLASMNKKTKPSQISEAISLAGEVEIGFGGNFIFGDPAETLETFLESMEFFINNCLDIHSYISMVRPYPGSKLFDDCLSRGVIKDKLEFYENIDKGIINMTSMPDNLWIPAITGFIKAMEPYPFVKAVDAFCCIKDESEADNIMQREGKYVWRVLTCCPHCGGEVCYRELLNIQQFGGSWTFFVTGCPLCNKRLRVNVHKDKCNLIDKSVNNYGVALYRGRQHQPEQLRQIVIHYIVDLLKFYTNKYKLS